MLLLHTEFSVIDRNNTIVPFDKVSYAGFDNFCFAVGEKEIPFSFNCCSGYSSKDVYIFTCGKSPTYADYSLSNEYDHIYKDMGICREELTAEYLASATEIKDFIFEFDMQPEYPYVVGERLAYGEKWHSDNNEYHLNIKKITFEDAETGKMYSVSEEVIEKFNESQEKDSHIDKFICDSDLTKYTDSMLYDSGTNIAELKYTKEFYTVEIFLDVRGEVQVDYKGTRYRAPSGFPEELKEKIKNNPHWTAGDKNLYVDMNNWFEYIYDIHTPYGDTYSDGVMFEDDLSKCTPEELKTRMVDLAIELIEDELR